MISEFCPMRFSVNLTFTKSSCSVAMRNTSTLLLENTCVTPTIRETTEDLQEQFTILKKCRGKFECLVYEMLFIQKKT